MNGYPEWTPASESPESDKQYDVTLSNGAVSTAYRDNSGWFKLNLGRGADVEINDVIAWMPLPPAYKPPKFGWHNPQIDAPKRSGEYLVRLGNGGKHWSDVQSYNRDTNKWSACATPLWWSHIEPTPT